MDAAQLSSVAAPAVRAPWYRRAGAALLSGVEWLFGCAALVVGLAILAAIPLLQVISLGYLLEVSGRVARSGRLRDGWIGIRKAARAGVFAFGTLAMLAPLALVKHWGYLAFLADAQSQATAGWRIASWLLYALLGIHILSAWYAGARLRHFFWPLWLPLTLLRLLVRRRPLRDVFPPVRLLADLARGRGYATARDGFYDFVVSLHLPYYFRLGFIGLLTGIVWLFVPVLLMVAAIEQPEGAAPLMGLIGGGLFVLVTTWLPVLQAHYAAQRQVGCMFAVRRMRELHRRAPIALLLALTCTLVLAVPLYLLKIEATPREATALPSLLFVALMLPARLITGWAVSRAYRRTERRHLFVRGTANLLAVTVAAFYVLIVFFTQYSSWYGSWSLLEQHAFLVPVPFLGLEGR